MIFAKARIFELLNFSVAGSNAISVDQLSDQQNPRQANIFETGTSKIKLVSLDGILCTEHNRAISVAIDEILFT